MATNVPSVPTTLVGRAAQLAELERLCDEHPVVTVTGTGGVGKTRLAIALAHRRPARFPDGVWLADLAPLHSPDVVEAEIAMPLGVTPGSGDTVHLIAEQLRDRRVLLLLDHCEHVVDAVAPFVYRLIGACPGLRVLATSRVPLGIGGEVTYLLAPLDDAAAVELFLDRARAADPAHPVPGDGVAALCARLDRIPLAIELAAPWVRRFTPAELRPRLTDRPDRPTADRLDLPAGQRSMRATVEWSHQLLSDPQRVLFRRLSVFAGPFGLDAAEQVCGEDLSAVAPLLAALRERSLLVVERSGDASRYRLLETLRDFARERAADAGEAERLRDRHAAYYLAAAERVDGQRRLTGSDAGIAALVPDADNYRAALDRYAGHHPESAVRLAAALEGFWMIRSVAEGRGWLRRALAAAPEPTAYRARALTVAPLVVAGGLAWPETRALIEESLAIHASLGDPVGLETARLALGLAAFFQGELAEALRHVGPATSGRPLLDARASTYRGAILVFTPRRLAEGLRLLGDGVERSRAIGDGWGLGLASTMLGYGELRAGRGASAAAHLRAALAGDLRGGVTATAVGGLGLAVATEDPRRALTLLEAAEAVRERAGVPRLPVAVARLLARAREDVGRRVPAPVADRCRRRARAMTTGEALAYALAEREPDAGGEAGRLTVRQQEIAVLVAGGLSNREIAERLHLSVRTVETHVDNILSTLDLHRRVQLAAWVAQAGLT